MSTVEGVAVVSNSYSIPLMAVGGIIFLVGLFFVLKWYPRDLKTLFKQLVIAVPVAAVGAGIVFFHALFVDVGELRQTESDLEAYYGLELPISFTMPEDKGSTVTTSEVRDVKTTDGKVYDVLQVERQDDVLKVYYQYENSQWHPLSPADK